ncbi:XRE family transcriptional regulator [Sphingomonas sp. 3-13AW]|uniref:XRE family transcriptional regulator n=1 Tax=Sphingomonas sp. 3-13AW TaxID=3050450 RepID=UPI003BB49315
MRTGERIAERRAAKGLSQTQLARSAGVSQATIGKLESGISSGSSHLHKIARALGTSAAYLAGETDDPSEGAVPLPSREQLLAELGLVEVAEIDLAYGMGGAFDGPAEVRNSVFAQDWLQRITRTPASELHIARGRGDSMAPTLNDGDLVIIDRSQRSVLEQDAIWALSIGEILMIKRLRVRGEQVTLLSDNDRVPADTAHPEEVNIVGRVIFIGRQV